MSDTGNEEAAVTEERIQGTQLRSDEKLYSLIYYA